MKKFISLTLLSLFLLNGALAYESSLDEALNVGNASLFTKTKWTTESFKVSWKGEPLVGVDVFLDPNSLEWIWLEGGVSVPRARLFIKAKGMQSGSAFYRKRAHPFYSTDQNLEVDFPVLLFEGKNSDVQVDFIKKHKTVSGRFSIQFNGSHEIDEKVFLDSSCSPFQLKIEPLYWENNHQWMSVSCAFLPVKTSEFYVPILEVNILWSGIAGDVLLNELPLSQKNEEDGVYKIRVRRQPSFFILGNQKNKIKVNYLIPEKIHRASLGVGLGPYVYSYRENQNQKNTIAPLVTLYGSYLINPALRLVLFEASPIHSTFWSDTGVYLVTEQFKGLDNRFSINLLLGGHNLIFKASDRYHVKPSAPQGFEVLFKDFVLKDRNLGLGSFLYPSISGKSYYNVWARWGTSRFFAELNYIAWSETLSTGDDVSSKSFGVTLGMPLFQFW